MKAESSIDTVKEFYRGQLAAALDREEVVSAVAQAIRDGENTGTPMQEWVARKYARSALQRLPTIIIPDSPADEGGT